MFSNSFLEFDNILDGHVVSLIVWTDLPSLVSFEMEFIFSKQCLNIIDGSKYGWMLDTSWSDVNMLNNEYQKCWTQWEERKQFLHNHKNTMFRMSMYWITVCYLYCTQTTTCQFRILTCALKRCFILKSLTDLDLKLF